MTPPNRGFTPIGTPLGGEHPAYTKQVVSMYDTELGPRRGSMDASIEFYNDTSGGRVFPEFQVPIVAL